MKALLPPDIQPTNEMLRLIAGIDEFKGEWRASAGLEAERLQSLRRIATIESVGSSTRIEGARLSDREVEILLGNLDSKSFQSRDEEEVAGYAYVMETVQTVWRDLALTEGILLQLHRDLLRYSAKDERHRGSWKTMPNHVSAFDGDGREVGIVFETASPFETPRLMEDLLAWHAREEAEPVLHPLLRVAVFNVIFLAIHPFQDGNGRLSRILTNLQMLRAGYAFAAYSSLESVIEHNKEAYYLALRRTQKSFTNKDTNDSPVSGTDWEPWLLFFLRAINTQIERLRERLGPGIAEAPPGYGARAGGLASPGLSLATRSTFAEPLADVEISRELENLSPLAGRVLVLLRARGTLSVAEAAAALEANRNTVKTKCAELVDAGLAELRGKGRGAHYRPVRR